MGLEERAQDGALGKVAVGHGLNLHEHMFATQAAARTPDAGMWVLGSSLTQSDFAQSRTPGEDGAPVPARSATPSELNGRL